MLLPVPCRVLADVLVASLLSCHALECCPFIRNCLRVAPIHVALALPAGGVVRAISRVPDQGLGRDPVFAKRAFSQASISSQEKRWIVAIGKWRRERGTVKGAHAEFC